MKRFTNTCPIIMGCALAAMLAAQLLGVVWAVRGSNRAEAGEYHAILFIDELKSLRTELAAWAESFVNHGDTRAREAFEQGLARQQMLQQAMRRSEQQCVGFDFGDPPTHAGGDLLMDAAAGAAFSPDEFSVLGELIESMDVLAQMEVSEIARVYGMDSESAKWIESRGGLEDPAYLAEQARVEILFQRLKSNALRASRLLQDHDGFFDIHWDAWVIVAGGGQSMVLVGLLSFHRFRYTRVQRRAYHDALTELPNRHYLERYLEWVCPRAESHGEVVILAFIDLNGFKPINDALGHGCGDAVLRDIARNLQVNCRTGDMAARFGGDEFVVVFVAPANQRMRSMERLEALIRDTFAQACNIGGGIDIGAAVGISAFPSKAPSVELLIQTADQAMYRAKEYCRDHKLRLAIFEHQAQFNATSCETRLAMDTRPSKPLLMS